MHSLEKPFQSTKCNKSFAMKKTFITLKNILKEKLLQCSKVVQNTTCVNPKGHIQGRNCFSLISVLKGRDLKVQT